MSGFRQETNFRELGGYKTKDGRTVRKGLLYRSAALGSMNERELKALEKMGIRSILDFRSRLEEAAFPDPPVPGATNYHVSAMRDNDGNDVDYSPSAILLAAIKEPGFNKVAALTRHAYSFIVFDSEAYQKMFELLLNEKAPLLFHCTQGKDRTGAAAILLLLALGVDAPGRQPLDQLRHEHARALVQFSLHFINIYLRQFVVHGLVLLFVLFFRSLA